MAPVAPVDRLDHDVLEQQLKDIIQDLYQVMVQVSTYDTTGRPSREVLSNEVKTLSHSLQNLHITTSTNASLPSVPPELLEYVENGRNPDIYTREFVELVRRGNQLMRGKMRAFGEFRDVLAREMVSAMPEVRGDVERVVGETGGRMGEVNVNANANAGAGAGVGVGVNGADGMAGQGDGTRL